MGHDDQWRVLFLRDVEVTSQSDSIERLELDALVSLFFPPFDFPAFLSAPAANFRLALSLEEPKSLEGLKGGLPA